MEYQDAYEFLDRPLAFQMIKTLLHNWFKHPQYGHLYADGIRQHMRTLQADTDYEDLWIVHSFIYCEILFLLRQYALQGLSEQFLEIPNVYRTLTSITKTDLLVQDMATVETLKISIRRQWKESLDGELAYVVETMFLKNLFKALDQRHEEFLREKRRRFKLWHEDLIATVLHPDRIQRLSTAAGQDFITYVESMG